MPCRDCACVGPGIRRLFNDRRRRARRSTRHGDPRSSPNASVTLGRPDHLGHPHRRHRDAAFPPTGLHRHRSSRHLHDRWRGLVCDLAGTSPTSGNHHRPTQGHKRGKRTDGLAHRDQLGRNRSHCPLHGRGGIRSASFSPLVLLGSGHHHCHLGTSRAAHSSIRVNFRSSWSHFWRLIAFLLGLPRPQRLGRPDCEGAAFDPDYSLTRHSHRPSSRRSHAGYVDCFGNTTRSLPHGDH